MQVVDNDYVVCFDVDDTLIMWIWDVQDRECLKLVAIGKGAYQTMVQPNDKHIELLKRYKAKGKTIVVWSQSGHEWAANVVKALQLEDYVDFVFTKPAKYVDDLNANEWMEQVYLGAPNKVTPHN